MLSGFSSEDVPLLINKTLILVVHKLSHLRAYALLIGLKINRCFSSPSMELQHLHETLRKAYNTSSSRLAATYGANFTSMLPVYIPKGQWIKKMWKTCNQFLMFRSVNMSGTKAMIKAA